MPNNNKPPIPPPRPSKTSVQQDNTRQNNPIYGIAPNESKELYATVNKPKKHDSREQGILYAELSHGESSSSRLPETDNKATYASISVKDGKTEVGPVLPERNYRPEETKPRVPNRSTAFNVNDKVPSPPSRTTSLDNARSSAEKRPTEKENKSFLHRFMKKNVDQSLEEHVDKLSRESGKDAYEQLVAIPGTSRQAQSEEETVPKNLTQADADKLLKLQAVKEEGKRLKQQLDALKAERALLAAQKEQAQREAEQKKAIKDKAMKERDDRDRKKEEKQEEEKKKQEEDKRREKVVSHSYRR